MDKTGKAPNYGAPHLAYSFCDPTDLLRRWRSTLLWHRRRKGLPNSALRDAPLFPGDIRRPDVPAVPNSTLNRRLSQYARQVGLDHLDLGTHPIRSGFANSARYLGVDDSEIMMAGGWTDVSVFQSYMRQLVPLHSRSAPVQVAHRAGLLAATPDDSFRSLLAKVISDAASRHPRCTCNFCIAGEEAASLQSAKIMEQPS
jgi:hypothetical protein